jgi:hypothetical protein
MDRKPAGLQRFRQGLIDQSAVGGLAPESVNAMCDVDGVCVVRPTVRADVK